MQLLALQMRTARMMMEAQTVIGMRMMGMAGMIPARPDETSRMVREKQAAFARAAMAGTGAFVTGGTPAQAYGRALAPIGRVTRANAKRLTKRG